jgi:phosphoribosyl-ATP pyrophosphohydrolase
MFKDLLFLIKKIKKNKYKNPKISYTANLFSKGKNFCIKRKIEKFKNSYRSGTLYSAI